MASEDAQLIPDFTPEDRALAAAVAKFAQARLAPRAAALDDGGSVVEHLPALAAHGILGMNLPELLGRGGGLGPRPSAGGRRDRRRLRRYRLGRHCAFPRQRRDPAGGR